MFNMDLHFSAEGAALLSPALRGSGAPLVTLYVRVGNAGLAELVNLRVGEFCGVVCGVGRECASLVLFNTYRLWTKLVLWHCLAGI